MIKKKKILAKEDINKNVCLHPGSLHMKMAEPVHMESQRILTLLAQESQF